MGLRDLNCLGTGISNASLAYIVGLATLSRRNLGRCDGVQSANDLSAPTSLQDLDLNGQISYNLPGQTRDWLATVTEEGEQMQSDFDDIQNM